MLGWSLTIVTSSFPQPLHVPSTSDVSWHSICLQMKISTQISFAPSNFPPTLRRKASTGVFHVFFAGLFFIGIIFGRDYEFVIIRLVDSVADFALALLFLQLGTFFAWILVRSYQMYRTASPIISAGGGACIHCGYLMDPNLAKGVCPECEGQYCRTQAIKSWSAVLPRKAKLLIDNNKK